MNERYYNARVKGTTCRFSDLILQKNEASRKQHINKLSPNREEPYRVIKARRNELYIL